MEEDQMRILLLVVLVLAGNLSCSVNILENFADKNTNEALYVDAVELMNSGDYTGALAKLDLMTGSYATSRKVLGLRAKAYAGRCGLEFLPLVEALSNMGTTRLFPLLMSEFRSGTTTARIDDCIEAENTVEQIGDVNARDSDENLLMVVISFAKIGNILSYYADTDQDGTVTNNYDVCTIGGARTAGGDMPDADARQLGSGITLAIENISAVSTSINLGNASLADIQAACTSLATLNPAYDFCSVTDPTGFTAAQLRGIRSLVKEDQSVGLDTLQAGCDGDVATCNCP